MSEDLGNIFWQGPPEREQGRMYPIYSPKPGKEVIGVMLSETLTGVIVYYVPAQGPLDKGRSMPCLQDKERCPGCREKKEHRWKGYVPCWDTRNGRLFLAEITGEAYARCPGFEFYKGQLRGKLLRLTRSGDAKNSRVEAKIQLWSGEPGQIPTAFNVQSALERIWFGVGGPRKPPDGPGGDKPAQDELFDGDGPYGR